MTFFKFILKPQLVIAVLTVLGVSACSNKRMHISKLDPNTFVQYQICLPNKKVYFKDIVLHSLENHPNFTQYTEEELKFAPKTVRRVIRKGDAGEIKENWIPFG